MCFLFLDDEFSAGLPKSGSVACLFGKKEKQQCEQAVNLLICSARCAACFDAGGKNKKHIHRQHKFFMRAKIKYTLYHL